MTWNNQSVTQLIVEEETTGVSGFFGYSPNTGSGNLAFSQSASPGTDSYGNPYPSGQAATNLPAVWYAKGNPVPTVVQIATMGGSGNTITGTFANPVTSGNTVLAAASVWGNSRNTVFTNVKFNNVVMHPAVNQVDTNGGFVVNGIFYLANVTTGGTAFTATYPNVASEGPFSGMVEVAGLGSAPVLTISSQEGAGESVASGSVASPGGSSAFYVATYAFDNNGSGTNTSGFSETAADGLYYLAGTGGQELTITLSQSAQVWLASVVAFANTSTSPPTTVQAAVAPSNTVDSTTGTGISYGFNSPAVNIFSSGTSTVQIPPTADSALEYVSLFFTTSASGTGTLWMQGQTGNFIVIGTG